MARAKPSSKDKNRNVWLDKLGKWQWEVSLTRRDGTEFRKHGSRKSEKDAMASRDKAVAEFNRNEGANQRGWTIQSWSEHCLDEIWPNELAPTTVDNYRHWLTTRVYKKIGSIRVDAISVPTLQIFFNTLKKNDGIHVAIRVKTAVASSLTRAMNQGLLSVNPCRAVKIKDKSKIEDELEVAKRILTTEEMDRIVEAAKDSDMFWPVLLGMRFGLRFGECLGLEWKHVDIGNRVIRVRQQLQSVKGMGLLVVPPKTKAGSRDIPIPSALVPTFEVAKQRGKASKLKWVCHRNGTSYSAQNGSVMLKEFVVAAGFNGEDEKPIPTHHDFRSSFLTFLANSTNGGQGVKPHVLMRIAGHSKLQTTMQYYIRATDDDVRAAMELT
jgi:integrase